jgi:hypothetical protein
VPSPPLGVSGLVATATGPTQVSLQWTGDAVHQSGFRIERAPGGTSSFVSVALPAASATSYVDASAFPGRSYDYRVFATNANGDSSASPTASATTPDAGPAITSIDFPYGLEAGGTFVTVGGSCFPDPALGPPTVLFGGTAATSVQVLDNGTLTCVTPPGDGHPGGVVDVSVSDVQGTSTLVSGFTYALEILHETFSSPTLDPALEDLDHTYTITNGAIVDSGNWDVRHYIRTVASDFNARDFIYEITFRTDGSSGDTVWVGMGSGTVQPGGFAHPPLDGVNFQIQDPGHGGGANVNIHHVPEGVIGKGIGTCPIGPNRTRIVKHGGSLELSVCNSFAGTFVPTLSTTVPDFSAAAPFADTTNSHLFFGAGWSSTWFADVLIVTVRPLPLQVGRVLPDSGPPSGGTTVTVEGAGFVSGGTPAVMFGGAAATNVSVTSDTTLTCTTPAMTSGPVDVVVSNANGTASSPGVFVATGLAFEEDWSVRLWQNPNLLDVSSWFAQTESGLAPVSWSYSPHFMATQDAGYGGRDFTLDLTFESDSGGGFAGGDHVYIGLGDPTSLGADAAYLVVTTPDGGGGVSVVVASGNGSSTLGTLAGGLHTAHVVKVGNALTFQIDAGASYTIPDLSVSAPGLATGTGRIFFGSKFVEQYYTHMKVSTP